MKKVSVKPSECSFNICHDPDFGFYAVVVKDGNDIFIYDGDVDRIVPMFFYKLQIDSGNTYGFNMKPEEARETLKKMGFKEDLELV